MTTYKIDDSIFDVIDTDAKAYILGFLYADGTVNKNNKQVRLKLQERDVNILNSIKKILNYDRPLIFGKKTKSSHQNNYMLIICSKRIYESLISKGLTPRKSFTLKFPNWLDKNLISSFVRGYFDGDGCISHNDKLHKSPTLSLIGSTAFCSDLSIFLKEELDIHSTISHDKRVKVGVDNLKIKRKKDIEKFYKYIYNDSTIHLDRKYQKFVSFFGELL